ncbi:MAG: sensor histidine kinase [Actinomycetota bacterium]|nr:PAS domain S-box protein [Actinomycetota bacterium]
MKARATPDRVTQLLIATVSAGGGLALLGVVFAFPFNITPASLRAAIILFVITAISELVAIPLKHGNSSELITLFEVAVVADLVLLPPSMGVVVAVAGLGVALAYRRRGLVKTAFNLGQYSLGLVIAAATYHGFGDGAFGTMHGLVALGLGMSAFVGVNLFTLSAILAATERRRFAAVIAEEGGVSLAMGIGNSAVGLVAVQLYQTRPGLVPAVLAPAVALHIAFRGWVKQKELSLRMEDERAKLQRIVEHSSEGIVLAESDGTVVLWSPSMEEMTGISADEAVGKALPFLLRGRGHHGQPVAVEVSALAEPFELEILTASGTNKWISVRHGPARDRNGNLTSDVVVINDVTRQREVERMKSDIVSTISHELRTPLTPIKGYASLLLRRGDEVDPERRKEVLESIIERTDHMVRLVEDLLLMSYVSREGERRLPEEVRRIPVDLQQVGERALRSFVRSHPHRDFIFDVQPEGKIAAGDPLRVEQMLANLISNAVKFSDEGTSVSVVVDLVDNGQIRIQVRDEGMGIPAEKHQVIFEKFRRLEDPMRMETGGAGVGLYIVKQLAQAMGGDCEVESALGKGSTFTVFLPSAASQVQRPGAKPHGELAG